MPDMGVLAIVLAALTASPWDDARPVAREELFAAMRNQAAKGYALTAISNSVRMQVGVFLELAENVSSADPDRRPLRVSHQDYFDAFLAAAEIEPEEAPSFVTVPYEFKEDYLLDYRMENVVGQLESGAGPDRALNVKAGWPEGPDSPKSYSYDDTSTKPAVEVTHQRVNAYRILDFGDVIVYDDIHGITGKATSGVLGLVFKVLGKARAVQTRFTFAPDGIQISRTTAKKLFTVTQTVTIDPSGSVLKGLPDDRPDLQELENLLKRLDVDFEYEPMDLSPMPAIEAPPRSAISLRWSAVTDHVAGEYPRFVACGSADLTAAAHSNTDLR